jgi:SAM-dependent methyltransferase/methyltransferase-like protein
MSLQPRPTSYDETPYPGLAYAQTHPAHLAALGTLLGLTPTQPALCSVLELGCTDGGNLIPMAVAYPQSKFVGVDLSATQIEMGQSRIAALGLTNISLLHKNILDIDAQFGQFDYILAHGIYSWVPPDVRDALLAICGRNLTPQGIAYVSYNTYPGWHLFQPIREILSYRLAHVSTPQERIDIALELLRGLVSEEGKRGDVAMLLPIGAATLWSRIESAPPDVINSILLHDILEENNHPVYFWQFHDHASRHGLQYLVESNFSMVVPNDLSDAAKAQIRASSRSGIDVEQYIDFYRGRLFRQTLLCHQDIQLDRTLRLARLRGLSIASLTNEVEPTDLASGVVAHFQAGDGATLSVDAPISKAALLNLHECWPAALSFEQLLDSAGSRLAEMGIDPGDREEAAAILAADLFAALSYSNNLIHLFLSPPPIAATLSARPYASSLARLQAITAEIVTTLFHENTYADRRARLLLTLLDGTRDSAALREAYARLIADEPRTDEEPVDLDAEVDRYLRWALWSGLLLDQPVASSQ